MSDTKLKPCPFCGGKAYKRIAFPIDEDGMEMNMYIVGCKTCDIEFSWLWDEECAIELWNTRKPMDNIVAQLEEEKDYSYADMDEYGSRYELNLADCDDWFYKGLARAIDIVKAGGVE